MSNLTITSNSTQNIPIQTLKISLEYQKFVYGLALTVALIAVIGNILLVAVILRGKPKSIRNTSSIFTITLSIFDFITGFVYALWYIGWFEPALKSENKALKFSIDFVHVKTQSSFLTVLAVTIERYIAVAYAMKYKSIVTKRRVVCCCTGIWLYSASFSSMVNVLVREAEASNLKDTANYLHLASHTEVIIVLVTVSILYYKMFKILQEKRRELDGQLNPSSFRKQKGLKAEKQFMTTILIIISILVISVVPHTIYMTVKLAKNLCSSCLKDENFMMFALFTEPVFLVAFAANPLIYAWRLSKYRLAFRSLLCCPSTQTGPLMDIELDTTKTT